jgi:excinuclease ABC subunit C
MFLLQRLRDEAHRFAITFHRKLRRERNFRSVLEEVSGIGDKRKRALLAHFGSLKRIRAAGIDEIAAVPGFNARLAERVHRFLSAEGAAKAAEAEAREAASRAADDADLPGEVREESGVAAVSAVAVVDRDDVAFDAAQAELEALEDAEVTDLADESDSES